LSKNRTRLDSTRSKLPVLCELSAFPDPTPTLGTASAFKQRLSDGSDVPAFMKEIPCDWGELAEFVHVVDAVDCKLTVNRNGDWRCRFCIAVRASSSCALWSMPSRADNIATPENGLT
jgi:hypothetical protein